MLDNWQTFAKILADNGYMAILVDQRDHGKSPQTDEFNYPLLAEDLKNFMEDNFIFKSHILGHSMGGKTAIQFAHDFENMVDKLIVVDIGFKSYVGGHEEILTALNGINLDVVTSRNEVLEYLTDFNFEPSISLFLMKNLTRKKDGRYQWKMNLPLLTKNYDNILSEIILENEIDIETLFVRGADSHYITDEDWNLIFKKFPYSRLVTVPNAGHWVHAQQPKILFDEINNFLMN
jgi:pimeloyl-ACP methyl ester carboxylesterase